MTTIDRQQRLLSPEEQPLTQAARDYWAKRLPNSRPKLPEPERAPKHPVTARRIIAVCAEIGKTSIAELTGVGRRREILIYRDVAAHLIRKHRNLSLPEIGRKIGRDHSTALHALRKVDEDLSSGGKRFGPAIRDAEKRLGVVDDTTVACE